jgi:hypothetical protein
MSQDDGSGDGKGSEQSHVASSKPGERPGLPRARILRQAIERRAAVSALAAFVVIGARSWPSANKIEGLLCGVKAAR